MPVFGRNPFPRRLGGGQRQHEIEHQAMLDRLAPGWDVSESTGIYAEVWAHALAVSIVWAINTRLRRCFIPADMSPDVVEDWETACRLRPGRRDTIFARRRAIAAKLRGLAGNTILDIEDTARSSLGARFLELRTVGEASATTYWPGINPGPPGFEWCSNRAHIAVVVDPGQDSDAERDAAISRLLIELDALTPTWMTFVAGTNEGAVADLAICDITLI